MAINRIDEFLIAITKSPHNVESIAQKEVEYLRHELAIVSGELSLHSLKRAYSRYRGVIKKSSLSHESIIAALSIFQLTPIENKQLASDTRKSVATDQLTQGQRPIDPDLLTIEAEKMLDSKSYLKIVSGLCYLTGRRAVEILRCGNFHYHSQVNDAIQCVENNPIIANRENPRIATLQDIQGFVTTLSNVETPDYLLFSGQQKQADSIDSALQPYPIPVLTSPEKIMLAIAKLRQMKPEFLTIEPNENQKVRGVTANDLLHSKCNSELGKVVKKVFGSLLPVDKCSPKSLRSAYAETCYHYFIENDGIGKAIYFSRILGHSENSTSTSQSYMDFVIV